MPEPKRSFFGTVKLVAVLIVLTYLVVVAILNTETVETHLLFTRVPMPRSLLLLLAVAAGFGLGVLTMYVRRRR